MNDLKYRLIGKKFREFFLPTLSMALVNNMALFVDSVLVSRLLGISRMPAIQLCSPIVTFVNLVYWMLGLGGSLLASNATADHDRDRADRLFSTAMTALLIFGLLFAALGTAFRGALATVIGYVGGSAWISRYLASKHRQLRVVSPFGAGIAVFLKETWAICVRGFPTASSQLLITVCTHTLNALITVCGGALGLQAYSVYKNSLFLGYILFIGTAQTLSPIASVYYHESDYDRVRFVLMRAMRIVLIGAVLMAALFALCPAILLKMYSIEGAEKSAYMTGAIRLFVISYSFVGMNFLMSFYWQAIKRQTLSAVLTALKGLILPLALVWLLSRRMGMTGVWAGVIAAEALSTAFAFAAMALIRRKNAPGMGSFLLPSKPDADRYDFSVEMDIPKQIRLSEEAGEWIARRVSPALGNRTCLALEEMLTGIALANPGAKGVIDVSLRDAGDEVVISLRDMGAGFNPTVPDPALQCESDNVTVLNRLAGAIECDRSLGMNATRIHLKK